MKVTIHQPEHLPWLGFFHKVAQAELFVILDNVQFRKNYFQNRNKIRTAGGWTWVKVPVTHGSDTLIKDIAISDDSRWGKKWWGTIFYSYKKANFFEKYSGKLHDTVNREWKLLSELNIALIEILLGYLGVDVKIVKASDLSVKGKGSELILEICKEAGASTYLSGISGKDYLKTEDFRKEDIEIVYQEFHHPIYKQLHEPFMPCMSVIDLLFNHGDDSLDIINGIGVPVMDKIFL